MKMMNIDFLIQGFTTRHWIGTAGVVTVMVLAAAGCWAAIQVSTQSNPVLRPAARVAVDPDPVSFGSWIRVCIKVKIQNLLRGPK
jgi:hypothetical protein